MHLIKHILFFLLCSLLAFASTSPTAGDDQNIPKNQTVTLDGSQSTDIDGSIVSYEWKSGDTTLSTEATFTKSDFTVGTHKITLSVTDNEDATSSDTLLVVVTDPSDTTPPVALITTPPNTTIKTQTDITGTASDDNLDYYELLISPIGEDNYRVLTTSNTFITDGTLTTLDATTLKNGIYDIKLIAVDKNGQTSTANTTITIKGKAKIGDFSFTITDFDIKVGGIPVQVNRTYSTLQRFENLDFGYAWSIDYQNVKVQESMIPEVTYN